MASRPRIILHIGAPKTGSTYLQKCFRAAPKLWRKHGIHVPVLPAVAKMAGNAKLLAVAIDHCASLSFERVFPDIDPRNLNPAQIAAELLKDWRRGEEIVLLSGENFRAHHAIELRNILPIEAAYTVVLFVRRQDDWVDSYYNQLIKTRDINEDINAFVTRICNSDNKRICCPDWYRQYQVWHDAFGQCSVVFFDQVRTDLLAGFLTAAGLQPIPNLPAVAPTQVSLGTHQLAYLLKLKKEITFADFARRRTASGKASQHLSCNTRHSLLSAIDRQRLHDRFESTNERLLSVLSQADYFNLLRIAPASTRYCDLPQFYNTKEYADYREVADFFYDDQVKS